MNGGVSGWVDGSFIHLYPIQVTEAEAQAFLNEEEEEEKKEAVVAEVEKEKAAEEEEEDDDLLIE